MAIGVVHTSTTTWSAPFGNRSTVPGATRSKRSQVAGVASATRRSLTTAELVEALRTPRVIWLAAPDWAIAAAGAQVLVATGSSRTGISAATSTEPDASGKSTAEAVAVLGTTCPSRTGVWRGRRMPTANDCEAPAGRPVAVVPGNARR